MRTYLPLRRFSRPLAVTGIALIAVSSACATIVWDLNPAPRQNAPVGSSTRVYTSQGYSITASGFDNNAGIGTPHELFYKNQLTIGEAVEFGLGLVNTPHNELQAGPNGSPLDFIQFDLTAILAAGLINGQISVGSIQATEAFGIYGSNTLGTLGTQLGGAYGSTFDNQFVNIPQFGQFNYYSIVAAAEDVLPIALRADVPAVPEANPLFPVLGLTIAVFSTRFVRRRAKAV